MIERNFWVSQTFLSNEKCKSDSNIEFLRASQFNIQLSSAAFNFSVLNFSIIFNCLFHFLIGVSRSQLLRHAVRSDPSHPTQGPLRSFRVSCVPMVQARVSQIVLVLAVSSWFPQRPHVSDHSRRLVVNLRRSVQWFVTDPSKADDC